MCRIIYIADLFPRSEVSYAWHNKEFVILWLEKKPLRLRIAVRTMFSVGKTAQIEMVRPRSKDVLKQESKDRSNMATRGEEA